MTRSGMIRLYPVYHKVLYCSVLQHDVMQCNVMQLKPTLCPTLVLTLGRSQIAQSRIRIGEKIGILFFRK